jgi:hypothetical protein
MGAANHDGGARNKNPASSLARPWSVEYGEFAKEFWKARRPRARRASDIFVQHNGSYRHPRRKCCEDRRSITRADRARSPGGAHRMRRHVMHATST